MQMATNTKAPTWVLNAVVNSVLGEGGAPEGGGRGGAAFIPASKFIGARLGYLFTKGDKGLG